MTRLVLRRSCLPLLMWLAIPVLMSGCSQGEGIPLAPPVALCERPLDPGWYQLNGICAGRIPLDGVWPEDSDPVVVGEGGMVLESEGPGLWRERDLGLSDDLTAIVSDENGNLVAVGENGALAVRVAGQWQLETSLGNVNWHDVRVREDEFWLVGDDGSLAVGSASGSWRMVDFPETTDLLSVCAFGDSVFVGGRAGLLSVLVDDEWENMSPPHWGQSDVSCLEHLPDGRLVATVDSLMIREADHWELLLNSRGYKIYSQQNGLEFRDGYLWVKNVSPVLQIDIFVEGSNDNRLYPSIGEVSGFAVGSEGRILVLSNQRGLDWFQPAEEDEFLKTIDVAGSVRMSHLMRLQDGTIVAPYADGLVEVSGDGVNEILGLSREIRNKLNKDSRIAGLSTTDFYFEFGQWLAHCVDGEIFEWENIPIGDGCGLIRNLTMKPSGQLFVTFEHEIWYRDEGSWTLILQEEGRYLDGSSLVTEYGTFIQIISYSAHYLTEQGMIPLNLGVEPVSVFEREPGILEILGYDDELKLCWWEKGTGASGTSTLDPLLGCSGVTLRVACERPDAILAATRNHSMVLKIPEDPAYGNWELVAGPTENEITDLEVLTDGTLVTINHSINHLMAYRPSGY